MAYAIIDTCTKDNHCIEACPVNCIHPTPDEPDYETAPHLYVHPDECIDCGACVPVCPTTSVFPVQEIPDDKREYLEINAKYFLN